ncbi:hypothetical protein SEA_BRUTONGASTER_130 [Gordonia phage BrutonGaster]|uniref:Uncharacterized protein n=1 Tax=Gordonia phage BrutonGaster TaxID=2530116 RepID=A0A482JN87_9CAUD|nr:hypothetical protein HOV26_gp052 [Gordonia phage BrutonGaster]QBP33344.1 hypothetical protein SEA_BRUTONGASTER_130 [Gordonia phage BrutonGaster]
MIDTVILENNTYEEIADALWDDLLELNTKAKRAYEVGDKNQWDILHRLINEDLDLLEITLEMI